jgi:signal transduction histidine kinase
VGSADQRRRARRIALLLSAILIPTAAVILLGFRVVRQERELSARRASEQRREALDQLRRELTARLQALRLEEVNRVLGESGGRFPPDSPIVFVAPVVDNRMVPPWEGSRRNEPRPTAAFAQAQRQGEILEFRDNDAAAAVASYRRAMNVARTAAERCSARVALGRTYLKAARTADAEGSDHVALRECGDVFDADGVPLALYAAERLVARGRADRPVADFVLRMAGPPQPRCVDSCGPVWRSPNEALLLESLLQRIRSPAAAEALRGLTLEIRNAAQISALAQDTHDRLGQLERASRFAPGDLSWIGYGDEPWLLTLVSPTPFAAPIVMAVSSRQIVPAGVSLRTTSARGAVPLGDGFVDLHVEWPAGRFAVPPAPGLLYGSMLVVVLGAALLAGYLLLRDMHREAATAEMRSQFVASVSHELKTPLTSIRAHAETLLLGRAGSPETTGDYLQTIISESERLTRLVDSVLDFSRIERGSKAYHLQDTRLDDVVQSAVRAMEHPLSQLGFTLSISTDGSAPTLRADPQALTQAILNLLGNAMKYSGDSRRIEIRVGTRDGEAFVDVIDHGIGIPRDEQSRIFERFHRVQSSETAVIAGTGLGLPLALHVVEAHRGHIAVVSRPGHGSTFSVRLPLQAHA